MAASARSYLLNRLRNGTAVGIVSFHYFATQHAPMTEITSSAVRDDLASKVPRSTGGATAIGRGLQTCQTVRNISAKKS